MKEPAKTNADPVLQKWQNSTLVILLFILSVLLCFSRTSASSIQESEAIGSLMNHLDSKRPHPSVQEAAARGVLQRLLPTHLSSFEFEIVSKILGHLQRLQLLLDKQLQAKKQEIS